MYFIAVSTLEILMWLMNLSDIGGYTCYFSEARYGKLLKDSLYENSKALYAEWDWSIIEFWRLLPKHDIVLSYLNRESVIIIYDYV